MTTLELQAITWCYTPTRKAEHLTTTDRETHLTWEQVLQVTAWDEQTARRRLGEPDLIVNNTPPSRLYLTERVHAALQHQPFTRPQ